MCPYIHMVCIYASYCYRYMDSECDDSYSIDDYSDMSIECDIAYSMSST